MKIKHIAIWTAYLEMIREFYQKYFDVKCGERYVNIKKGFSSYFLSFENGARLEIMSKSDISEQKGVKGMMNGLAHFAVSVGSTNAVDSLTSRLKNDGFKIISEPRRTGDGYYESVISDPEGNHIE